MCLGYRVTNLPRKSLDAFKIVLVSRCSLFISVTEILLNSGVIRCKAGVVTVGAQLTPNTGFLDDVNEILGLHLESEDMNTIGGWLLEQFGYLPSPGNVFVLDNVIYTVEDVFQRRIVSIRIRKNYCSYLKDTEIF